MPHKHTEVDSDAVRNKNGLSIIYENGARTNESETPCAPQNFAYAESSLQSSRTDYYGSHGETTYSGYEPNLIPLCHEIYTLRPDSFITDQRRHPRISPKNVKACIELSNEKAIVVDVVNVSRGGVCFRSSVNFDVGSLIAVATHYIEGGQNIFQDGRIVRVQQQPTASTPGKYAVEFAVRSHAAIAPPPAFVQKPPASQLQF
jgi:hypothetical protein